MSSLDDTLTLLSIPCCPRCGSYEAYKMGYRENVLLNTAQIFKCRRCSRSYSVQLKESDEAEQLKNILRKLSAILHRLGYKVVYFKQPTGNLMISVSKLPPRGLRFPQGRGTRVAPEIEQKVLSLANSGHSYSDIEDEVKIGRGTISRIVHRSELGIKRFH